MMNNPGESNVNMSDVLVVMRNILAVSAAGVIGEYATIGVCVWWASWQVSLPPPGVYRLLPPFLVVYIIQGFLLPLIGCVPAGLVASLIATARWRRRCAVLAGGVAWLIYVFVGGSFLPEGPWGIPLSRISIVLLCGLLAGGLVGNLLYETLRTNSNNAKKSGSIQ